MVVEPETLFWSISDVSLDFEPSNDGFPLSRHESLIENGLSLLDQTIDLLEQMISLSPKNLSESGSVDIGVSDEVLDSGSDVSVASDKVAGEPNPDDIQIDSYPESSGSSRSPTFSEHIRTSAKQIAVLREIIEERRYSAGVSRSVAARGLVEPRSPVQTRSMGAVQENPHVQL